MLADKQYIKTDGTFESKLQVRDVALTVLEEISGESFMSKKQGKPTQVKVKEIVMFQNGDTPVRFHIADLTDDDYVNVSRNVEYWIDGYLQGMRGK